MGEAAGRGGWRGNPASIAALAKATAARVAAAKARKAAQAIQASGEPAPEFDPGPIQVEEGMPHQLADMRHVYLRPESADTTFGQRACREWLKANISGFMAAKSRLEEAFLEYERDQQLPNLPPGQDDGYLEDLASDRIEAMIEELLERAKKEAEGK
jgi:hypothetical protein